MTTHIPAAVADLDFARALTLVERRVVLRFGEVLKAEGATLEEWRVLSFLGDGAGHPMTEIAEFALMSAPTLTKVVDRMVSLNLVLRRVDDVDRRRVLVFASERGSEALTRWTAAVEREQQSIVTALGTEETALLRTLLQRAARHLG
ncbi:MarR family winged helix-turn-helix transcriptional regulator [Streptomyces sp. DH10]|uniref:MarR family winged helix-turn-helix transcriptional regulator n=1 Tax=Streptomyces sp. DH10 TaxID=3040121 RepID=UPI0024434F61|nr:MarR family winged helix-turn-helix transcriptional regulator [Streptomyces sp. DH10]MDG9707178.1 MarR family winged helix-turn-helix transcriptional regulator [Streptomyces sp. DH10]